MALTDDLKALEARINELSNKLEQVAGAPQDAPQNRRERADAKKAQLEEDRVERREKSEENLNRVRDQRDEARGSQLDEGVKELESAKREQEDFQSGDVEMPGDDLVMEVMQKDPQALQHFEALVGKSEEEPLELPADPVPDVNLPKQRELRTNAQPGYITLKAEDSTGDYANFEVLGVKTGDATAPSTATGWWQPTFDIAGDEVTIAAGSVTGPLDDRTSTLSEPVGFPHQENYHHFLVPQTTLPLTTDENNYYFLKVIFSVKYTDITTASTSLNVLTTSIPTPGTGSSNSHTHTVPWLYRVTNYYIPGVDSISIIRTADIDATAEGEAYEDIVGVGATIQQYLGHCNLDGSGNITDQAWRTGHTIDFRLPSYTALEDDTPTDP